MQTEHREPARIHTRALAHANVGETKQTIITRTTATKYGNKIVSQSEMTLAIFLWHGANETNAIG